VDPRTASLFAVHPSGYPAAVVAGRAVSLSLFIPPRPVQKPTDHGIEPLHRHRVKVLTPPGRSPVPQMYPDPRSERWEQWVAQQAVDQLMQIPTRGEGEDFTLPLREMRILVNLRFNLPKPKSYPKRIVHHIKKPDIDNYAKALIDGLVKGRIIEDDGLITDLAIQKRYLEPGHPEGVEVDLTALPTEVP
jgi:Holliday junction resolvase RusA-like endonuclease